MKLLLISIGRMPWYREGGPLHFFYTPRIGLPSLAAVTPKEWEVEILDGIPADEIDFSREVDLVGFSLLTPFANDSYRAADRFRQKGVKVVMGGVHASLMPDEAKRHCDSVVIGEGEEIWPGLVRDVPSGDLKDFYRQKKPVRVEHLPIPDYSLIKDAGYMVKNALQLMRGCPLGAECRFCVVSELFGKRYRTMPVDIALRNIREFGGQGGEKGVNLSACCALNHREYMTVLAEAFRALGINWCGGALLHRIADAKYIALLAEAGCSCVYTETEVVSPRKDRKKYETCRDAARKLTAHGIDVSYNFTVGLDTDSRHVFDEMEEFIDATGLRRELCAAQIYVPWPGTAAYKQLENEGRIIDRNWSHYDNLHVVFVPKMMPPEELAGRVTQMRRAGGA